MSVEAHWESVFTTKPSEGGRWYRPHLETSLKMIENRAPHRSASIIDVGAGESTLVDDLLARGYETLSVLDVSPTAVEATKKRLGAAADKVQWIVGDITRVALPRHSFDVWH